jgi:hypothetical protein
MIGAGLTSYEGSIKQVNIECKLIAWLEEDNMRESCTNLSKADSM